MPEMSKKIYKGLWSLIIEDLTGILLKSNENLSTLQVKAILTALEEISAYFYLGGRGLSKEFIDSTSVFTKKIVDLWMQPTPALILLHFKMKERKEKSNDELVSPENVTDILHHRSSDPEAVAFCVEQELLASGKGNAELQQIRDHFLFSKLEVILERYTCKVLMNEDKYVGLFVLGSRSICFDVTPLGTRSPQTISILLIEIGSILKTKVKIFWEAIEIHHKSKIYTFYEFDNRDNVHKLICDQTVNIGNTRFTSGKKE